MAWTDCPGKSGMAVAEPVGFKVVSGNYWAEPITVIAHKAMLDVPLAQYAVKCSAQGPDELSVRMRACRVAGD